MRPLEPGDGDGVAQLIRRAFGAMPVALQPSPSALTVTGEAIAAHLAAGGGGAVDPGRACLLWIERDGGLHLSRLAVALEHRRQGLAHALLARAETAARDRGLPHLALSTRLALTGNHRLFTRFGFIEGGRSAHPGYAEPTMVDFAKPLRPMVSASSAERG